MYLAAKKEAIPSIDAEPNVEAPDLAAKKEAKPSIDDEPNVEAPDLAAKKEAKPSIDDEPNVEVPDLAKDKEEIQSIDEKPNVADDYDCHGDTSDEDNYDGVENDDEDNDNFAYDADFDDDEGSSWFDEKKDSMCRVLELAVNAMPKPTQEAFTHFMSLIHSTVARLKFHVFVGKIKASRLKDWEYLYVKLCKLVTRIMGPDSNDEHIEDLFNYIKYHRPIIISPKGLVSGTRPSDDKVNKCDIDGCNFSCDNSEQLHDHLDEVHDIAYYYDCPVISCEFRGLDPEETENHYKEVHDIEETVFPCHMCTEIFTSDKDKLDHVIETHQQHLRADGTESSHYLVDQFDASASNKIIHLQIQQGIKKFKHDGS